jgi:hypothetical protein
MNHRPFLCHPEAKPRDLQYRGPFVEMFSVILRGCDFLIFLVFSTPNRNVFQNSHKTVILSEAPRGSIA